MCCTLMIVKKLSFAGGLYTHNIYIPIKYSHEIQWVLTHSSMGENKLRSSGKDWEKMETIFLMVVHINGNLFSVYNPFSNY